MCIIFFGSGRFAVPSLEALVNAKYTVSLVVTVPDKPKGRRLNLQPTEVKIKADELHLEVFQPQNPNSQEAVEIFKNIPADIYVVIAYGHILKDALLALPALYPLNVHASLLPKYRGAAPIHWAIIQGEKETGVTVLKMNRGIDTGDILLQKKTAIEDTDDAQTLSEKLARLSAVALLESLESIRQNTVQFTKQNEPEASFAPKLEKENGLINWNDCAGRIVNQIRGLCPWPGAYAYHKRKMLKIFKARALNYPETNPGRILAIGREKIVIGCQDGAVEIFELQPENGKRMTARAFTCGYKIHAGEILG